MHLLLLITIPSFDYITHVQHLLWWSSQMLITCAFFTLIAVLRLGIRLGQLIYFVAYEGMSGRLVNTCSSGCCNCKGYIDTCLTYPVLSCTANTSYKIFLQILNLGLHFESNASFGVWFSTKTMSPILKSVLSRSLIWEGQLSLAV